MRAKEIDEYIGTIQCNQWHANYVILLSEAIPATKAAFCYFLLLLPCQGESLKDDLLSKNYPSNFI